jgi:hypothetical protein
MVCTLENLIGGISTRTKLTVTGEHLIRNRVFHVDVVQKARPTTPESLTKRTEKWVKTRSMFFSDMNRESSFQFEPSRTKMAREPSGTKSAFPMFFRRTCLDKPFLVVNFLPHPGTGQGKSPSPKSLDDRTFEPRETASAAEEAGGEVASAASDQAGGLLCLLCRTALYNCFYLGEDESFQEGSTDIPRSDVKVVSSRQGEHQSLTQACSCCAPCRKLLLLRVEKTSST